MVAKGSGSYPVSKRYKLSEKRGLVLSEGNKISSHVKTIFPILPSLLNPFF